MRKFLSVIALLVLSSTTSVVSATDLPPDVLIKETMSEVLDFVKKDSALLSNEARLLELVDAKILPHFDFSRMTKLAVGKGWRTATPEQKQALTTEFRTMLVRTYTKVFTTYRNPKVEVKSVQVPAGVDEIAVKTIIGFSDGRSAKVEYEMAKTPMGWKAFDVTLEGVSLVSSYRGSFADEIQQSGVDGLIKKLSDTNKNALVSNNSKKAAAK
ncbi:MAG: ABC transporter substrate-binding protein [Sideroxydans sp.]|nr:ABC transporter substrate-binding protein [Sideroxydans sp.]